MPCLYQPANGDPIVESMTYESCVRDASLVAPESRTRRVPGDGHPQSDPRDRVLGIPEANYGPNYGAPFVSDEEPSQVPDCAGGP